MAANRNNLDGTMADQFRIGKRGPTIHQGTEDPNLPSVLAGVNGDLYVRVGTVPRFYQFEATSWIDVSSDLRARRVVTDAAAQITENDTYIGVQNASAVTLTLPPGRTGVKIVIKDEIGRASDQPITVVPWSGNTIDGEADVVLYSRDALTLYYGAEWHII